MADIAIAAPAVANTPSAYTVKGSDEIVLKSARVHYDGSGAAGSYVPVLQLIDPGGIIVCEVPYNTSLAAGVSVDMTWFHGVGPQAAAAAGGSGIQFVKDPQSGAWLVVTTTGTEPVTGVGMQFTDTGGGGINFKGTGFGQNTGGVYVEGDDAGAAGFPVALGVQMTETSTAAPTAISATADASAGGGGVGASYGAQIFGVGNPSAGAVGVGAEGSISSGTGTFGVQGVVAQGVIQSTTASGDAIGISASGQTSGAGKAIGIDATGVNAQNAHGDTIGARITAKQNAGGLGTLYGMQVFIGTTKVFQVNSDGSLHGLTGKALTFDL